MKRTCPLIFCLLLMLALGTALSPAACAATANAQQGAQLLNDLGLFQGTPSGFSLDRAPTRAEAFTMLIRFLGHEEEALATEFSAEWCDDVEEGDWYAPFVCYAYETGLTEGLGDGIFAPDRPATCRQFSLMMLRALGYDAPYEGALSAGRERGLFTYLVPSEAIFTRGDMALLCCGALQAQAADGQPLIAGLLSREVFTFAQVQAADFTSLSPVLSDGDGSSSLSVTVGGLSLSPGMTDLQVANLLGAPDRVDPSPYDFDWHVYASEPDRLIALGMKGGRLRALYTNAPSAACGPVVLGQVRALLF